MNKCRPKSDKWYDEAKETPKPHAINCTFQNLSLCLKSFTASLKSPHPYFCYLTQWFCGWCVQSYSAANFCNQLNKLLSIKALYPPKFSKNLTQQIIATYQLPYKIGNVAYFRFLFSIFTGLLTVLPLFTFWKLVFSVLICVINATHSSIVKSYWFSHQTNSFKYRCAILQSLTNILSFSCRTEVAQKYRLPFVQYRCNIYNKYYHCAKKNKLFKEMFLYLLAVWKLLDGNIFPLNCNW